MMKFKNSELVAVSQFLKNAELTPKMSRVRTKLRKCIQSKIDELYKDEIELVEKYGERDDKGELVEKDGSFSLVAKTAIEYHQEKNILLEEEVSINVDELTSKLSLLLEAFDNSEEKVSGSDAEILDLIMDKLESEVGK